MTKKLLDELVQISFKDQVLDEKVVLNIADNLTRRELKAYVRALKAVLRRNTVTVITSRPLDQKSKSEFEITYAGKHIVFLTNPDILLGVKIINNDIVYNNNLKDTFENITEYVRE